ncbi:MAG: CapA family protein, partial [Planctomycetaceae bacterium]|nr:CapA family protein [Planctomycetaceae bacterium]
PLKQTGLQIAGAAKNQQEAEAPAIFDLPNGTRVLVFALGSNTSGVPSAWSAGEDKPGVHLFDESSGTAIERLRKLIDSYGQPDDLILVSIHWGPNWSYEIPWKQQNFAHALIDDCGVHLVHGHSSHHVKGIEVYHNKLILYGCGDLLTDYEGIEGYEMFRGDLGLLYFVTLDSKTGNLMNLDMQPTQMKRLQLKQASLADRDWLAGVLNREGRAWRTRVSETDHNGLTLHWD